VRRYGHQQNEDDRKATLAEHVDEAGQGDRLIAGEPPFQSVADLLVGGHFPQSRPLGRDAHLEL
jgi:hypothetical protein